MEFVQANIIGSWTQIDIGGNIDGDIIQRIKDAEKETIFLTDSTGQMITDRDDSIDDTIEPFGYTLEKIENSDTEFELVLHSIGFTVYRYKICEDQ